MKPIFLLLTLLVLSVSAAAGDILTLNEGSVYEGKVTKIKDCSVLFKIDKDKFIIPSSDIYSIQFEDVNDKVYTKYMSLPEDDQGECLKGSLDAENLHGKNGGHVLLGFLFGPVAIIGTALSNPTPEKGRRTITLTENQNMLSDPTYLACYKKKAKDKLMGMELLGMLGSVLFFVLASIDE